MKNNHPAISKIFLLNFTLRSGLEGNLQQGGSKYLYLWWELPDDSVGLRENKKCFKMKLHYHSH